VFSSNQTIKEDSLFIVTPAWKTFTEEDGTGFYFELMKMLYEPIGIKIDYQITPWARSVAMISLKQADALVGSYLEQADLFHYPQQAIWRDISSVVFKPSIFKWKGIDSLQNKNIGWIRGYGYDAYFDVPMNVTKLIDNKQAWKLLELNRIDFYIESLTDLKLYMQENTINSNEYEIENVLSKDMYVRFAKTAQGKKFADIFDQRIVELKQNGQLKELYLKWGYSDNYTAFIH
tara:strand:+ start:580 stop:1278 length:699 start_codon:yes stop_codon:yes gene_type:complete